MCGVAGIVDFARPVAGEVVESMIRRLRHRGPDAEGIWHGDGVALASRRLAILDLSPLGNQPMASADGLHHLVHNGEIYNFKEVRTELAARGHAFRSGSDTEVVLAAYREWGSACVDRFNGMWAFALWDGERRELFCARDRLGVKPFYYTVHGQRLMFASELKAFEAARVPLSPNPYMVRDFLEHGVSDHTSDTFFDGLYALPPAHPLSFDETGLRVRRYWAPDLRDPPADEPVEAFRELLLDAVRLRLRSDVPIGVSLSGGLDSSVIACTIDRFLREERAAVATDGQHQDAFNVYFEAEGSDERVYANDVVRATGCRGHFITFDAEELVDELPAIVEAHDEPFRSSSIAAQWFLMRSVHDAKLKVMLEGQGGDEVVGGYDGLFAYLFGDLLRQRQLKTLVHELNAYREFREVGRVNAAAALARPFVPPAVAWNAGARYRGARGLVHGDLRRLPMTLPLPSNTFPDMLRRHMSFVLQRRLPELLRYADRNSMAHSVEARMPFLDYRLVELMFSLDAKHLISDGRAKVILRDAFAGIVPPRVIQRTDKIGFATPEGRWLGGGLGTFAEDVLSSPAARSRGFVDVDAALTRLRQVRAGSSRQTAPVWRALSVELWAQRYIDR